MSDYPGAIDSFITKVDNEDYVLADHVNLLQSAMDAVQSTLGTDPQGAAIDVKTRIGDIDTSLTTHKTSDDHDLRYGGDGWDTSQTLMGHAHTGGSGKPNQINLDTHVTGVLKRTNILLTYDNANALRGSDIAISGTNSTSITTTLDNKLGLGGGTLTGNLTAPRFLSTVAQGTAPFSVNSSTMVSSLNANFIMGRRVSVQTTTPASASTGDIWIDTA